MATTVEFYEDNSDPAEWRWRVTADATVIGKSSEGYSREQYATNNFQSLPKYCRAVDIKTASDDADAPAAERLLPLEFYQDTADPVQWRWRITAQNGRIVHASDQGWSTKAEAVTNVEALVGVVNGWTPA